MTNEEIRQKMIEEILERAKVAASRATYKYANILSIHATGRAALPASLEATMIESAKHMFNTVMLYHGFIFTLHSRDDNGDMQVMYKLADLMTSMVMYLDHLQLQINDIFNMTISYETRG